MTYIASNCVYWGLGDGFKFHYLLSHSFGEAHTPFCADTLGALLQAIQQHEVDTSCHCKHFLIRRTDGTLVTHSTTRSRLSLLYNATPQSPYLDAKQAVHTIHTVCTNAAIPIQHKKTKIAEHTSLFDGFIFHWTLNNGSIHDKKHKLLRTIAQVRYKFKNGKKTSHKFFSILSHSKLIESLVGQLEWASQVFYYLHARIPAIRAVNYRSPWHKHHYPNKPWTLLQFSTMHVIYLVIHLPRLHITLNNHQSIPSTRMLPANMIPQIRQMATSASSIPVSEF